MTFPPFVLTESVGRTEKLASGMQYRDPKIVKRKCDDNLIIYQFFRLLMSNWMKKYIISNIIIRIIIEREVDGGSDKAANPIEFDIK